MRISRFVLTLFTLFLLSACSKNPYERYIGLWERQGVKRYEVLEIQKQGDALLLQSVMLSDTAEKVTDSDLMMLGKAEGQLVLNTGFGSVYLALSDNNTLHIGDERFNRIKVDRLNEIKAALALEEQQKETLRLAEEAQRMERQAQREHERLEREAQWQRERLEREAKQREQALQLAACQELHEQINAEVTGIKKYASNNKQWTEEYEKIKKKFTEIAKDYVNCNPGF